LYVLLASYSSAIFLIASAILLLTSVKSVTTSVQLPSADKNFPKSAIFGYGTNPAAPLVLVVAPVIPGTDCTLALSVPSLAIVKPLPTFTPPRVSEEAVGSV